MTDEEIAEEYKERKRLHCVPKERYVMESQDSRLTEIKQAYLAGLKAGRPKWHSPDEHISKNKVVLGIIKHCNKPRYSLVQWNGEWWFQYGTYNAEVRLIVWCEIPTYTEE